MIYNNNLYTQDYNFGLGDVWNTVKSIPKIASGIGAVSKAWNKGDFSGIQDWLGKNMKSGNGQQGFLGKAADWVKNNKGLAAAAATGIGNLMLNGLGNKGQKQTSYFMPGMGGGMSPMMMGGGMMPMMMGGGMMPMMNPMMGGGGMFYQSSSGGGNGLLGNIAKAALPALAMYGINKWANGNNNNGDQKTEEKQTDAQYASGQLNSLMTANPNYAEQIQNEYDNLSKSVGERNAADTLTAKYKGGYKAPQQPRQPRLTAQQKAEQAKQEQQQQSQKDISQAMGNKRAFWDLGGKFDDWRTKRQYDRATSGMTDAQKAEYQKQIAEGINSGKSWQDMVKNTGTNINVNQQQQSQKKPTGDNSGSNSETQGQSGSVTDAANAAANKVQQTVSGQGNQGGQSTPPNSSNGLQGQGTALDMSKLTDRGVGRFAQEKKNGKSEQEAYQIALQVHSCNIGDIQDRFQAIYFSFATK